MIVIVIEALLRVAKRSLETSDRLADRSRSLHRHLLLRLALPADHRGCGARRILLCEPASRDGATAPSAPRPVPLSRTLRTAALWLAIWLGPLLVLALILGRDHVTTDISIFFSKLAVVTFGGAYSVLAYMAQQAVETYHWLTAGEMLDGLGLAETTPGPLILVTEFVGFLAAFRRGGEPQLAYGLLGAAVTLGRPSRPASYGSSSVRLTSSG